MSNQTIRISELPLDVQQRLPYSIRKFADEYNLSDLPADIRQIVQSYVHVDRETPDQDLVFDTTPNISHYGDLSTIINIYDLVVEYMKNYLQTYPNTYPFDPSFGCELKYHLLAKDTYLRQTKVSSEIDRIANIVSSDLNVSIKLQNVDINKTTSNGYDSTYNIKIQLLINNIEKDINMSVSE